MALQPQVIPLTFNKGLDTKSDDLTSQSFLLLQNAFQQKTNSIQQRNGVEYVPQSFSQIKQVFTHNDSAFVHDTFILNKYTTEANSNYFQPQVADRQLQTVAISRDDSNLPFTVTTSDTGTVDIAMAGDLEIYIFNNPISTTTFYYGVYQPDSQTYIRGATLNGNYAKAITIDNKCFVFANYLNQIGFYIFNTDGTTNGVFNAIDSFDSYSYEVRLMDFNNKICLMYTVSITGTRYAKLCYVDSSGSVTGATTLTTADPVNGGFALPVQPMCLTNTGPAIFACWLASVSGTQYKFYSATLDSSFAITDYSEFYVTIDTAVYLPTAVQSFYEGFSGKLQYYVGLVRTNYSYATIHNVSFDAFTTNLLQNTTEFLPSLNIYSRIFEQNGHFYMFCIYDTWYGTSPAQTGFQATVFLVDITNFGSLDKTYYFVGKCSYQLAYGFYRYYNLLPTPAYSASMGSRMPIKQKTNIQGTTTTGISFDTITYPYTFDFRIARKFNADSLNRELFVSGGMVQYYDGQDTAENNFLLYPEIVSTSFTAGTGLVAGASYQYVGIFTYTDNLGNVHRSDVSNTVTVTFTNPPATSAVYINVRAFIATNKRPSFSLYRTTNGGSLFYLVTTVDYSVMTTEIFAVFDDNTDAVIVQNPLLYTTGGVLANYSTSSASLLHTFQNRLFIAGLEDPNTVYFSKEYVVGDGIGFAQSNALSLDAKGGPITAIYSMDDKFIIFKNKSIYFTSGNGPDDTGNNGFFAVPQLIAGEIGCINPNSIARIPNGLMFQSAKGIYLLNRNLTTQYIGDNVEIYLNPTKYSTADVIQATLIENTNQVVYALNDGQGTCCVYDYYFDQWYIYTYPFIGIQGTGLDHGKFVIADDNYMYIEGEGFLDVLNTGNVAYNQTIDTPWYAFAGFQGFQRFYSLLILGKYYDKHTLQISSYFDYEATATETVTIIPSLTGNISNGVYQFQYKPKRQKCEAVRFRIVSIPTTTLGTESGNTFSASAISCTVGVKPSSNRMPSNRRLT